MNDDLLALELPTQTDHECSVTRGEFQVAGARGEFHSHRTQTHNNPATALHACHSAQQHDSCTSIQHPQHYHERQEASVPTLTTDSSSPTSPEEQHYKNHARSDALSNATADWCECFCAICTGVMFRPSLAAAPRFASYLSSIEISGTEPRYAARWSAVEPYLLLAARSDGAPSAAVVSTCEAMPTCPATTADMSGVQPSPYRLGSVHASWWRSQCCSSNSTTCTTHASRLLPKTALLRRRTTLLVFLLVCALVQCLPEAGSGRILHGKRRRHDNNTGSPKCTSESTTQDPVVSRAWQSAAMVTNHRKPLVSGRKLTAV